MVPRARWARPQSEWYCRCDCGTRRVVSGGNLTRGLTLSCGCLRRELLAESKKGNEYNHKHGHAPAGRSSPEYRAWAKMKDRCGNPNSAEYKNYGARGIAVCERWSGRSGFPNFLADMGPRPSPELSLDRIDNGGDYTPNNCRWATRAQQNANRRPYKRRKSITPPEAIATA